MPKQLERRLLSEGRAKGLKGEALDAYVYGSLRKTGWIPSTQRSKVASSSKIPNRKERKNA